MVRLLVEEARDALPLPNLAQRGRNDRFLISTSTARALPRSGFVQRPQTVIPGCAFMSVINTILAHS